MGHSTSYPDRKKSTWHGPFQIELDGPALCAFNGPRSFISRDDGVSWTEEIPPPDGLEIARRTGFFEYPDGSMLIRRSDGRLMLFRHTPIPDDFTGDIGQLIDTP